MAGTLEVAREKDGRVGNGNSLDSLVKHTENLELCWREKPLKDFKKSYDIKLSI